MNRIPSGSNAQKNINKKINKIKKPFYLGPAQSHSENTIHDLHNSKRENE